MSESKRGGAQLARAVEKAYQAGQDDYHLEPMVLVENGKPVGKEVGVGARSETAMPPCSAAAAVSGRSS